VNRLDAQRQLDKVISIVNTAANHHRSRDDANARLHLAQSTRYSPLTVALEAALDTLVETRNLIQEEGVS
jgi:hypothetical protein